MKKLRKWIIIVVLGACVAVWGLIPMTSEELTIHVDETKLQNKLAYLESLHASDSAQRPNLIIIMADDLGKMDISTYGGSNIQTPQLDTLASEGATFTQGYVTSPICSPSRAGLLTGRNQARFGYHNNIHERYPKNRIEQSFFKYVLATDSWRVADVSAVPTQEEMEKQGISPDEILLSELLHRVGYRNGVIGKWHLGYSDMSIPINRGFDYHYGFYEAFTLYQKNLEDENTVNQTCPDFSDPFLWEKGRTGSCAIRQNHVEIEEEGYLTDRIADEAVQFIETNADTSFFLFVAFSAPHTPFQAQKKYYDQFDHIEDPVKRVYAAMIKNLDDAVGRINQSLKNSGIDENTIVVFLSDNGGATYTTATTNAPLKGGKLTHFEGGLNVPFFIKWPGQIDTNVIRSEAVLSTDVFATITGVLGIDLPKDRDFDGVNLLPYLQGQSNIVPHEELYWQADYLKTVRKGSWKYIQDNHGGASALYNLREDPYETSNLLDSHPDKVSELQALIEEWGGKSKHPAWPRVMDFKYQDGDQAFYFPL